MICDPPATFPPTTHDVPVAARLRDPVQQTTTLLPGGQVARVTDRFTSVDGHSHTVDALFSQSVAGQASGETPGFQFPGQRLVRDHASRTPSAPFPPGPGSIIVISNANGLPARDLEPDRRDHLQPASAERRLHQRQGRADRDVPDALRRHRPRRRLDRLRLVLLAGGELRQPRRRSSRSSATASPARR